MKQKSIVLSLCLVAALMLSGCSKKDTNSTPSTSPSTTPSASMGLEGEYEADDHGAVDGNGAAPGTSPVESGTPNDTTRPDGTADPDHTGDGVMNDVGDAVDDLVDDAKRAVRDATK